MNIIAILLAVWWNTTTNEISIVRGVTTYDQCRAAQRVMAHASIPGESFITVECILPAQGV